MITAWEYMRFLAESVPFWSTEKPGTRATSSEIKRWLKNGSIECNGEKLVWDEEVNFSIFSLVMHPKSKKNRNTLI